MELLPDAFKEDCKAYAKETGLNGFRTVAALWGGGDDGSGESTVYAWAEGRRNMPALAVQQAAISLGQYRTISALCRNVGGAFVLLPRSANAEGRIIDALRECSEAFETVSASLADGRVSPLERKQCEKQIDEAVESLLRLKQLVAQAAAQPKTTRAM